MRRPARPRGHEPVKGLRLVEPVRRQVHGGLGFFLLPRCVQGRVDEAPRRGNSHLSLKKVACVELGRVQFALQPHHVERRAQVLVVVREEPLVVPAGMLRRTTSAALWMRQPSMCPCRSARGAHRRSLARSGKPTRPAARRSNSATACALQAHPRGPRPAGRRSSAQQVPRQRVAQQHPYLRRPG
jgi:hypothetical protein